MSTTSTKVASLAAQICALIVHDGVTAYRDIIAAVDDALAHASSTLLPPADQWVHVLYTPSGGYGFTPEFRSFREFGDATISSEYCCINSNDDSARVSDARLMAPFGEAMARAHPEAFAQMVDKIKLPSMDTRVTDNGRSYADQYCNFLELLAKYGASSTAIWPQKIGRMVFQMRHLYGTAEEETPADDLMLFGMLCAQTGLSKLAIVRVPALSPWVVVQDETWGEKVLPLMCNPSRGRTPCPWQIVSW